MLFDVKHDKYNLTLIILYVHLIFLQIFLYFCDVNCAILDIELKS